MNVIEKIVAFIMSIVAFISGLFGFGSSPDTSKGDFRVTSYIRGGYVQKEENLNFEDFDIITDVILFECATFNSKGEIEYDKERLETALSNIKKAIQNRDINITVNLIGPEGSCESDVWKEQMKVQSQEHNKAFASGVLEDNIVDFLKKYNFDGVHFDYEYPITDDAWEPYNNFLVSLNKKLGSYTLGVAAGDWNLKFTAEAIEAVDVFEIMLYDYVDENGKHSTYETTVQRIKRVESSSIPLNKVDMGLPFYSRPTDMSHYSLGYSECYEKIDENGWYHSSYLNKDFWFNTPDVIAKKTQYAKDNGYGGVMVWHYNCDLPSTHEASLLKAVGSIIK